LVVVVLIVGFVAVISFDWTSGSLRADAIVTLAIGAVLATTILAAVLYASRPPAPSRFRRCPMCGGGIPWDALLCPYCGQRLP
jgi:hypothetical protein